MASTSRLAPCPDRQGGQARRQRGRSLLSLLYLLFTLAVLAVFAIRSVPVYLEAYAVEAALERLADRRQIDEATAGDIREAIRRSFDASYVDGPRDRDIVIRRNPDGSRDVRIAWEVRRVLMFNLSIVYAFDKQARLGPVSRDE